MADHSDKKIKAAKPADKRLPDAMREPQMGAALRSVYQQTVEEAVPDEFLDLLSKLD